MRIDPMEVFLWTFRRNERDVVNLYDALSDLMRQVTCGDMLNFGYWKNETTPLEAQNKMSYVFADFASLSNGELVLDVGSGLGAPASLWMKKFPDSKIISLNVNDSQLRYSKSISSETESIQSTATVLPFADRTFDKVMSLEAAQHFRPIKRFFDESYRILKQNGSLALAIPVVSKTINHNFLKLGILSFTWSSEHYNVTEIESFAHSTGFEIKSKELIGSLVYDPLAKYYVDNRKELKNKIRQKYPSYVEKILYRSIQKMNELSKNKTIDYLFLHCIKN